VDASLKKKLKLVVPYSINRLTIIQTIQKLLLSIENDFINFKTEVRYFPLSLNAQSSLYFYPFPLLCSIKILCSFHGSSSFVNMSPFSTLLPWRPSKYCTTRGR